jgi:hypothetical protein
MRSTAMRAAAVLSLAGACALGGCTDTDNDAPAADTDTGKVQFALSGSGVSFSSAGYTVMGPADFSKTGTMTVTDGTLSGFIGGIPVGAGYSITIDAVATDGSVACSGTATFDVISHQTTPVVVPLVCRETGSGGSLSVTDTVNVCPAFDSVLADPESAPVGTAVALTATAHDRDNGPAALSYHWIASDGTFDDADVASPTYTCPASPETVTLTVTVSDGGPGCSTSASVTVTCTP